MKQNCLISLFTLFLAATLTSCGSDDDKEQVFHESKTLRTDETASLPGALTGTSSNIFVASFNNGVIQPHHVGTATLEATGYNSRYYCTIEVVPIMNLFTDLGDCVNRSKDRIEQILGASTSHTGYNYKYPTPKLEKEIQVRYNKDYMMDFAMISFEKVYSDKVTDQIKEYYGFYEIKNEYTVYINANTFDESSVLLVRSQTGDDDRIIYMTPSTYLLIGDLTNIFSSI